MAAAVAAIRPHGDPPAFFPVKPVVLLDMAGSDGGSVGAGVGVREGPGGEGEAPGRGEGVGVFPAAVAGGPVPARVGAGVGGLVEGGAVHPGGGGADRPDR